MLKTLFKIIFARKYPYKVTRTWYVDAESCVHAIGMTRFTKHDQVDAVKINSKGSERRFLRTSRKEV